MKYPVHFLLVAILLLVLAACNNDKASIENKEGKEKVEKVEPSETKETTSFDITGYWNGGGEGDYYSLSKNENTYSLNSLLLQETIQFDVSNVNSDVINATVVKGLENYVQPGEKIKLKITDNNRFSIEANGDTEEFTRVKETEKVDPLDLVGNWMNDKSYFTITKDNNVITASFEDGFDGGQVQFDISMEITDVVENFVFGKVTKFLPEDYANADNDLHLGAGMIFRLSDDKTKLSVMGDPEVTKTDMSFEEFKEQQNNE